MGPFASQSKIGNGKCGRNSGFPVRGVLRKLLDSRGVLGQFLLGMIVDFLT